MFIKIHQVSHDGVANSTTYHCLMYSALRVRPNHDKKPSGFAADAGLLITIWGVDDRCHEVHLYESEHPHAGYYAMNDNGRTIDSEEWNLTR